MPSSTMVCGRPYGLRAGGTSTPPAGNSPPGPSGNTCLMPPFRAGAILAALLALSAGACGGSDGKDAKGKGPSQFGTIGLLLPETVATRYETFDRPLFKRELIGACPRCKLLYANAEQDPAKQESQ